MERSWTTSPELSSGIGGLRLSCGSHPLALNTPKDYASALFLRRLRRSDMRCLRTLPYLSNVGAIPILSLLPRLFRVGRSSICSGGMRMFLIVLPSLLFTRSLNKFSCCSNRLSHKQKRNTLIQLRSRATSLTATRMPWSYMGKRHPCRREIIYPSCFWKRWAFTSLRTLWIS